MYYHKQLLTVLLFSCMLIKATAQKQEQPPPGLDAYIQKTLATFEVPGAAVGIVHNGKTILAKGYGIKKLGSKDPVDEHTLFCIASNSKAFTATALAILEEEGKLKWDDPVIDHLPWFRMSDTYVTSHLTVRDLLVHHSGLSAYAGDMLLFPPSTFSRKEIVEKIRLLPLQHDFRTTYAYDNILYLAAGELIAAVSGMSWEEFVRVRILDKAGMKETLSRFSLMKASANVSASHSRNNKEVKIVEGFFEQGIGDAANPAGGIASNAGDMCRWMITQLDSGRTPEKTVLFKPTTTEQLWKIIRPMPITKNIPELKAAQMDFYGYALGFRSYNYGRYKVVGHGGALDGFVSQVAMVPELGLGVVVLTNQESTGAYWSVIYHILDHYMKNPAYDWTAAYRKQLDSSLVRQERKLQENTVQPIAGAISPLPVKQYAGKYKDPYYGDVTISENTGKLTMVFEQLPQLVADLQYFQYNSFIARFRNADLKGDAYINFSISEKGNITGVTMKSIHPNSSLYLEDVKLVPAVPEIK
ncbi:serine hydrolase [Pseudobacter ginsenosidimutans]|uniref:CubicO group peptidase (Beta-lactamase class C family) n=1 Tax=Pseudobacter ginsenosidimutans TaxID=661488 RepID=A0A4Q7N6H2_9BACT|nr:serine hydrolase [Pseudobacter ginsenosidimutans]QEC45115.1 serine hydrolase [Pseudobacter ginsenosidimutans]RZS76610.1 CubicO group peptidase (beta-lactamase class C family) [Pseudobacter ginsenosidimutans]